MRPLSITRETGLVQEQAVTLSVSFELRDSRTGRVLVARRGFQGTGVFIPAQDVGERLEVGQNAAIDNLADDIVNELRSNW